MSNITTKTQPTKKFSLRDALGYAIVLAIILGIVILFGNLGLYMLNSTKEQARNEISVDLGGGLYLGAEESTLTKKYKFGKSDKAYSDVLYKTTDYTTLFGMRFDVAEIHIRTEAISTYSFMNKGSGGQGVLSSMILEKGGTTKEVREFARELVTNMREEGGLIPSVFRPRPFYRHYTLVLPHSVVEVTYEGYFKHSIKLEAYMIGYSH